MTHKYFSLIVTSLFNHFRFFFSCLWPRSTFVKRIWYCGMKTADHGRVVICLFCRFLRSLMSAVKCETRWLGTLSELLCPTVERERQPTSQMVCAAHSYQEINESVRKLLLWEKKKTKKKKKNKTKQDNQVITNYNIYCTSTDYNW